MHMQVWLFLICIYTCISMRVYMHRYARIYMHVHIIFKIFSFMHVHTAVHIIYAQICTVLCICTACAYKTHFCAYFLYARIFSCAYHFMHVHIIFMHMHTSNLILYARAYLCICKWIWLWSCLWIYLWLYQWVYQPLNIPMNVLMNTYIYSYLFNGLGKSLWCGSSSW